MTDGKRPSRERIEEAGDGGGAPDPSREVRRRCQDFREHLPHLSAGIDKDKIIAAGVFSYYGLCIAALRKQYSDGIKYCQLSLKVQSSNPEHYENQAKIHLLARARGRAVDALFEGLSHDPNNKPINKILDGIGRRREPVITFLPRDNVLNVYFGKKRHEKFERRREAARRRRQQQHLKQGRELSARRPPQEGQGPEPPKRRTNTGGKL